MSENTIKSEDVNALNDVLEVVSDKIPKLISELLKTFYSEEAGSQMGKAVGSFYKELVNAGMPADEALEMAQDYMHTIKSLASTMTKNE